MILKNILWLLISYVFAYGGTIVLVIISLPFKVIFTGFQEDHYQTSELIFLLTISLFSYIWSGFIIAKIAKVHKLISTMIYSCLLAFSWFLSDTGLPLWYVLSSIGISFPLVFIGAKLHLNKANKSLQRT